MSSQLEFLINKFNIINDSINALVYRSNYVQKGIILDTLNLKQFNNFKICEYFKKYL